MMSAPRLPLGQRIAAAFKRFRFAGSGSGGGYGYGGYGSLFGGWLGATPGTRYDFAKEVGPLHTNGVVLAAVNWFALTWSEAPLVVYRPKPGDKPEMLKEHPALDLMKGPNPDYDDTRLWGGAMLSILTAGNSYWAKEFDRGGRLRELYRIPEYLIHPWWKKDGSEFISGYKYRVGGSVIDLDRNAVVQLSWPVPNPANDRLGLSPLSAELKAIALDNEVSNYTATILRNMGLPGIALSPKGDVDITPAQAEAIKTMFNERFTGDNRGEVFVSSIPMEIHAPGYSPEQMALGTIVDQPVPRICAALRIDPMVLGYASPSKTFSNLHEAMEAAYERTLIPLHAAIDSQMTEQIMPDVQGALEGDYFGRDYAEVRALQEDQDSRFKRLTAAVGGAWMSPNEARQEVGLPPIEGGDELKQPMAGVAKPGEEDDKPPPRAASLSPLQAAIGANWRVRAEERKALAARNGA